MYIGSAVHPTEKLAAARGVGRIDSHNGHLAYGLIGVDEGIDQRIGEGDEDEEYQHAGILEDTAHLHPPHIEDVEEAFFEHGT